MRERPERHCCTRRESLNALFLLMNWVQCPCVVGPVLMIAFPTAIVIHKEKEIFNVRTCHGREQFPPHHPPEEIRSSAERTNRNNPTFTSIPFSIISNDGSPMLWILAAMLSVESCPSSCRPWEIYLLWQIIHSSPVSWINEKLRTSLQPLGTNQTWWRHQRE